MLCRFYSFGLSEVMAMTVTQVKGLMEQIPIIIGYETGGDSDKKEQPLDGEDAHVLAKQLFPKAKR